MKYLYICQLFKSKKMRKPIIFFNIICVLFVINTAKSQNFSNYNHDLGVMAGPVFFQSDYGERYDVKNFTDNAGYSIGAFYYLNIEADRHNTYTDYLKLRIEVSYMKNNLQHFGKWVDDNKTSLAATQLRAMRGSIEALNFGAQVEYYPFKTDDFSYRDWNPYVSFGGQYSYGSSRAWSEMGVLGNPAVTPEKYMNGAFRNESNSYLSLTASVGVKYVLDNSNALVADLRSQYFFSDWVDGLNPDSRKYTENKTNDWLLWFNVGYIYSFD